MKRNAKIPIERVLLGIGIENLIVKLYTYLNCVLLTRIDRSDVLLLNFLEHFALAGSRVELRELKLALDLLLVLAGEYGVPGR